MFNLQGSELIIILLLALVVLGPEKLPDAMRKLGQLYAEIRKMSSGFQEEFRSVMDEPVREMRDTANLLRDSADFTKLQDGEREEKPKSGEMPSGGDLESAPTDDVPFREDESAAADAEPDDGDTDARDTTDGGATRARPFSGNQLSSAAPRSEPSAMPTPPVPFASSSDLPIDAADVPDATDGTDATEVAGAADDDEAAAPADGRGPDEISSDDASSDRSSDDPAGVDAPARVGEAQGTDAPGDPTR